MGFYDQAFSNIGNVIDRAAMTIGGKILANDMIKKSEKPTEPDKLDINKQKIEVANQMKDLNTEEVGIKKEESLVERDKKDLEKLGGQFKDIDEDIKKNFNDEWQEKYDTAMKSMQGRAEAIAVQRQNFELRKKLITERMNLLEKGGKK